MTVKEYKEQFSEEDAVGWLSIDRQLEKIYPNQEPKHFAPSLYYSLGGEDPLDGISVYESKKNVDHFHFVTYGFSELYYDEENVGKEFSKYGFELTFRLKKKGDEDNLHWACNLLQNIARYVFNSGKWFEPFHLIPANGPIRQGYDTAIVALTFVIDPELRTIETPHGEVQFLQMVGLTSAEYDLLKADPDISKTSDMIDRLATDNSLLVTDLDRK